MEFKGKGIEPKKVHFLGKFRMFAHSTDECENGDVLERHTSQSMNENRATSLYIHFVFIREYTSGSLFLCVYTKYVCSESDQMPLVDQNRSPEKERCRHFQLMVRRYVVAMINNQAKEIRKCQKDFTSLNIW